MDTSSTGSARTGSLRTFGEEMGACRFPRRAPTVPMDDITKPTFQGGELLAGKYRVERLIGEGGMGVVLAARHEGLNTNVAIKLLRGQALGHSDIVGRFMREARAAVSLRSEHVARVFDVGTLEDGRPYIVMERLEGKDLGDVIEQDSPLAVSVAVDYVMQACEAIAEAHAAGIIHRDLKPKNLFLTHAVHGRPLVKVLDFGISKVDPSKSPNEMALTRTTEVIGSPSYMSPEQLRSARNVDARTDIWALGVILYELLTKRIPFYAETVTELVLVVVTEREPPVRSIRPDVPEGLDHIVQRCLQKHPDHRFQNVYEFAQALEPFANGHQASMTERIRAVAQASQPLLAGGLVPTANGSGHGLVPTPSNSSRVNVHGHGTSVAWGETQSVIQQNPHLQQSRGGRSTLLAMLGVLGALLVLGSGGGAAAWYMKHHAAPSTSAPFAVGDSSAMPLPPGRKDLPPTPPPPEVKPEPPAATALPDTRKPPVAAAPVTPKTTPIAKTPTAPSGKPKSDDLSDIGRR